jgi:predicted short-subunit dehydrogenase-like oxidoreductase (DUF2520 family)
MHRLDRSLQVTETMDSTLSIVGAGRAGSALAVAFAHAGYRIAAVHSRTAAHAEELARAVGAEVVATAVAAVRLADVTLLTVPDGEIAHVAATVAASGMALRDHAVVHCSARLGPDVAAAVRVAGGSVGVLHPLQAMSGAASASALHGAFFRLEAEGPLHAHLARMVADLDGHVLTVEARNRNLYHAAAVLAGNAPLALLARATELLEAAGIERQTAHEALAKLLEGAAANARAQGASDALTGPVVRGDSDAIAAHLAALEPYPDARDLYAHLVREMEQLVRPAPASQEQRPLRVA